MSDELIDALDECLRLMADGVSVEDALARYPGLAAELRPRVVAARAAQQLAEAATVPQRAEMASRAALLARAAELRAARSQRALGWGWLRLPRALATAGVAMVITLFVGAYTVVSASASLPGDRLYPVKRAAENVQLLLAVEPTARAALEDELAARRDQEIQDVLAQGREATVEFRGVLTRMAGEVWRIGRFDVQVTAATRVEGAPAVGQLLRVEGVSQADGLVRATRLRVLAPEATERPEATETPRSTATPDARRPSATPSPAATERPTQRAGEEIEFTGIVEAIGPETWQVGGVTLRLTPETEIRGDPQVGQRVEVRALRMADGSLIARRIRAEDDDQDRPTQTRTPNPTETRQPTRTTEPTRTPEPSETRRPTDPPQASRTPEPSHTPQPTRTEQPREVEFEGQVQAINGEIWIIADKSVIVTGDTELRGNPQVGSLVRVKAIQHPDGRLVAERIEVR